jgi:hypothetical protein
VDLRVGADARRSDASSGGSGGSLGWDGGDAPCTVTDAGFPTGSKVDFVFVVDNSSSMGDEIAGFTTSLNVDLHPRLEASGLDYRVVVISRYGLPGEEVGVSDHAVCVQAPLSSLGCDGDSAEPLVNNPPRFFQYSADVDSRITWCLLLESFAAPDELPAGERDWTPLAPGGWSEYLRADAFKSFVVITDDGVECSSGDLTFDDTSDPDVAATTFDEALRALSPELFGDASLRRYEFHSVVGVLANDPVFEPWPPTAPLQAERCGSEVENPGLGYQALSVLTGGLRYPTCQRATLSVFLDRVVGVAVERQCLGPR